MTTAVTTDRADRVADALAAREADLLLVTDLYNVRWLTGFTGSNAAALVGRDGTRRFVTDFRYLTQSAEQLDPAWGREIAVDLLAGAIKGLPAGDLRLGFDDAHMSVRDHAKLAGMLRPGIELVPAAGAIEELRAIKDDDELEVIRGAARLADDALTEVLGRGLVGRTERDVALDLEFTMRRMGAEAASFPPIVAAGDHGALPHAAPRDVAIPAGTLCVVDWGAKLDGYASDCTRTFATGALDPRDRAVYDVVLRAQEEALAAVRPGPTGREVDAVARAIIDAAGHGEHFGHGLGHGVGLDVHEGPRLSKQGETALAAGMVVTVEPGVYVPGAVGVRIEDLVVVTDGGAEVVSSLPKELQVVA
ncbi:MAG: Xaa-Pro aminopeptidase [Solirubrobacteraceae bacterium]|jgi:Xaa-Pro aminopeptidase|nr:Xaa-Pro aminopeptidase [Solirubrobacteraceae bacterium]